LRDFINPSEQKFESFRDLKTEYPNVANLVKRKDQKRLRLPKWLHQSGIPSGEGLKDKKKQLKSLNLATVCQEAKCPNIGECWNPDSNKLSTATIMIMGYECTRGCRFCSVKTAKRPALPDPDEPQNVANAVKSWKNSFVVITMVDRDDLPDHGAQHVANVVQAVKKANPEMLLETLVGDFKGREKDIETVAVSGMEVFSHNIEAVRECQWVRDPRAGYEQSLKVLRVAKEVNPRLITKSSIMLGFGETDEQVYQTLVDLRKNNVDAVTLGQYMQPKALSLKVQEYVHPDKFKYWKKVGDELGFVYTASGPLVRSSYKAGEYYLEALAKKRQGL